MRKKNEENQKHQSPAKDENSELSSFCNKFVEKFTKGKRAIKRRQFASIHKVDYRQQS